MPQGWRPTHPGDPTPRWGLSKTGRLVIAITVAAGMAIAFMVIAVRPAGASDGTASPARSQEPSPWIGGQRVEMPEHGFAVTVPDGWVVREMGPEATQAILGEGVPDGRVLVLAAFTSSRTEGCAVVVDDPGVRDVPVLFDGLREGTVAELAQNERVLDVKSTRVELAAGLAWRIDYVVDTGSESRYLFRGFDRNFALRCSAPDPPDDRWFSIANTLEFLPDPATGSAPGSPVLGGGRIERPEEGFAVTFPDDWTVEEVTPEIDAWILRYLPPARRALRTTVLWADPPDSDGFCTVVDMTRLAEERPTWVSVETYADMWVAVAESDSDWVGLSSTTEHLPAGLTGHASATAPDANLDRFYFADGDAWFYLECWSPDPPEDHWLSVAETFEFLPAEE